MTLLQQCNWDEAIKDKAILKVLSEGRFAVCKNKKPENVAVSVKNKYQVFMSFHTVHGGYFL